MQIKTDNIAKKLSMALVVAMIFILPIVASPAVRSFVSEVFAVVTPPVTPPTSTPTATPVTSPVTPPSATASATPRTTPRPPYIYVRPPMNR